MPLSKHEQSVLQEMERGLSPDPVSYPSLRRADTAAHRDHATSVGLIAGGVLAITTGLALENHYGTILGVVGFILLVGACRTTGHRLANSANRWVISWARPTTGNESQGF